MAPCKPAHCQFDRIQQRVKYAERLHTKHALQILKIMACLSLSMAKVSVPKILFFYEISESRQIQQKKTSRFSIFINSQYFCPIFHMQSH